MCLPPSWIETAKQWQTLIASSIAIVAAIIAWHNTSRTLKANAALEKKRRSQKHAALRATLPLSLSNISSYCFATALMLNKLWEECVAGALPKRDELKPSFPELPTETVKAFADFIEYSDDLDTSLFTTMLARLQVNRARLQGLEQFFDAENDGLIILERNISEYLLDVASIYAATAAAFDYGREKTNALPNRLTWDSVRSALRNMRIWEPNREELYETIERRERDGIPP